MKWLQFSVQNAKVHEMFLSGMKAEGIYRLSGQHSKVTTLLENFAKSEYSMRPGICS